MLQTYEQHSRRKLIATILTVLVIAGVVVLTDHFKSERAESAAHLASVVSPAGTTTSNVTTTPDTQTGNTNTAATSATSSGNYKDGTYTTTSSYFVPSGNESIRVSVTLKDGTVSDVAIQNSESDQDSAAFQEDFAANYKSHVVGKKISGLQLNIIAGASETTSGFNEALNQIASKARA